jgi:hypothetical protein
VARRSPCDRVEQPGPRDISTSESRALETSDRHPAGNAYAVSAGGSLHDTGLGHPAPRARCRPVLTARPRRFLRPLASSVPRSGTEHPPQAVRTEERPASQRGPSRSERRSRLEAAMRRTRAHRRRLQGQPLERAATRSARPRGDRTGDEIERSPPAAHPCPEDVGVSERTQQSLVRLWSGRHLIVTGPVPLTSSPVAPNTGRLSSGGPGDHQSRSCSARRADPREGRHVVRNACPASIACAPACNSRNCWAGFRRDVASDGSRP